MTDALGYAGLHVVVTGCTSGIGLFTTKLLGQLGAVVHGLDRRKSNVALASFTPVDLSDPLTIERAAHAIPAALDIVFNCAGLAPTQPALDVLKVNFLGTRYFTECLVPRMNEGGAIVSVSSNGGLRWRDHFAALGGLLDTPDFEAGLRWLEPRLGGIANAYSFAKEALTVWTMRESARLIGRGIRINCVSPGVVQTPMLEEIETVVRADLIDAVAQPIGRRSTPEEQAWPLLMLGSPRASYCNGVDLAVDGGFAARMAMRDAAAQ